MAIQKTMTVAPDLAIEVMSPTDKDEDLEKRLKKYAEAGTVTWVFYPKAACCRGLRWRSGRFSQKKNKRGAETRAAAPNSASPSRER